MSAITTHVLDLALGRPAAGIAVQLERQGPDGTWITLSTRATDADGRVRDFHAPGGDSLAAGVHRLTFTLTAYFAARGERGFFPRAALEFEVSDPAQHHHVPLLLSPYGYSTYRGS